MQTLFTFPLKYSRIIVTRIIKLPLYALASKLFKITDLFFSSTKNQVIATQLCMLEKKEIFWHRFIYISSQKMFAF